MTKPTEGYPDFAMTDVNDPSSGQPNVVSPSAGKKDVGWVYNEKPPRQYVNWLARVTSKWIRYLDGWADAADGVIQSIISFINGMDYSTGTFQGYVDTSASDITPSNPLTFKYTRFNGMVTIEWPQIYISANDRTNGEIIFKDVTGHEMPLKVHPSTSLWFAVGYAQENNDVFLGAVSASHSAPYQLTFMKAGNTTMDKTKNNQIDAGAITFVGTVV